MITGQKLRNNLAVGNRVNYQIGSPKDSRNNDTDPAATHSSMHGDYRCNESQSPIEAVDAAIYRATFSDYDANAWVTLTVHDTTYKYWVDRKSVV